jgi:hypothetical protein
MTTRSTRDEIAFLKSVIQSTEKMAATLLAVHGDGVRPSWVSEELASFGARIDQYNSEIAALEATL